MKLNLQEKIAISGILEDLRIVDLKIENFIALSSGYKKLRNSIDIENSLIDSMLTNYSEEEENSLTEEELESEDLLEELMNDFHDL